MIEAVTFDWWDTMALTTEEQDEQLRELRIERLAKAVPDLPRTREALLQTFLTFAGLDPGDAVLVERVSEAFGGALLEIPPALFPHVPETLEELKREGVAIGLVSNTGRTWGRYIRKVQDRFGIGRHFDVRIFSDEVGLRKPLPEIFEAALEGLGLPADRVVHVGDDIEADVIGAKDVGMRAVWFQTDRRGYRPRYRLRPEMSTDRADAVVHDQI